MDDVRTSQETRPCAVDACYGKSFTSLYVDDVRTSQETRPCAVNACYGESFTSLYVDDVRTSQETCPCAVNASYGAISTFYLYLWRTVCGLNGSCPLGSVRLLTISIFQNVVCALTLVTLRLIVKSPLEC
jgi:hypothetical protein